VLFICKEVSGPYTSLKFKSMDGKIWDRVVKE
jgi:hypothetical protein